MKLVSTQVIDWTLSTNVSGVKPKSIRFGKGGTSQAIQIALGESASAPSRKILKDLYSDRKAKRGITLMVVVISGEHAYIFGPDPDTIELRLKLSTAESFLNSILDQDNGILAYNRANALRRSIETTSLPGFTNNGLFASYYIRSSINSHPKWSEAVKRASQLQSLRHKKLIEGLGFEINGTPAQTLLLSAKGKANRAVAVLLDRSEAFEAKSPRFQASPVEWGLSIANENSAPWLIAINDAQLRLYPAKDGVGVAQKSQAETYFEIDLITIDEDKIGLLDLIFSAEALAEGGTAEELLKFSRDFASDLGSRLKERVYEQVVPSLAKEVANQLRAKGHELDSNGLQLAYELTLRILFRLLFQAYAEDRGLLPAGRNERFDANSMKRWAEHLRDRDMSAEFGDSSSIWLDLVQIWDAIDQGNPDMQIPAYNGGLFGSDPELHPAGDLIRKLSIPDRVMGPTLRALVIDDQTEDGVPGAVDFRSLSVREFGTIYEGLLESSLSVADQDLTVDKDSVWIPAKEGALVLAKSGEVYFHSSSGERKATGSYYTPSFIVDHLIERSVEPALNEHLAKVKQKIDAGDQAAAYAMFFDFRVADLAMGSAHFLVAAIDKIETIMRSFLLQEGNSIDRVSEELMRLDAAAKKALGADESAYAEIERASLLRRQIARRCIYGLDINPLAVELSRLAIWIHTFVPGLPMSSLEHNLVCANSLTGIGSIEEALNILTPERSQGQESLFDGIILKSLLEAGRLLEEVAKTDEADKKEALKAAEAAKLARQAAAKSKTIFDLAVAVRNGVVSAGAVLEEEDLEAISKDEQVNNLVQLLQPAHLPYLFPEVMLREPSGFDVLIGNPPFKEVVIQELDFWNIRFRGLKGLSSSAQIAQIESYRNQYPALVLELENQRLQLEAIRKSLGSGPFPGMGVGDPDLYKAFAWKFMNLVRQGGAMGLVLPNSVWNTKGSAAWRRALFTNFDSDVILASNGDGWAFENVNVGYKFTFIGATRNAGNGLLKIRGTFKDRDSFTLGRNQPTKSIEARLILESDEIAPLPSLESQEDLALWQKLLAFPPLSDGRLPGSRSDVRCAPATEIHVALDGKTGVFTSNPSDHPIYNHLNVDRFLFNTSLGPFNYTNYGNYVSDQEVKALKLLSRADSAIRLWGRERLETIGHPIRSPRIVFRDVVHASNSRKVWFALAPRDTLLTNNAPYLVFANENLQVQSYVLGIMNSGVVDWFGSLKIGLHLNFFILYTLPVPLFTGSPRQLRISSLAAGLALSNQGDFGGWAELAVPITDSNERIRTLAEIDALVAEEFGLTEAELGIVFGVGNTLRSSLKDVLQYWKGSV